LQPGRRGPENGRPLLQTLRTHIHYARVYIPVGTHRPNDLLGEKYTVYIIYSNTNRVTGGVRPIFYFVRVTGNGFVATQIARSQLIFEDSFGGNLFVMWIRHYGLINPATNPTSTAAQELFTDTVFLDWANVFAEWANTTTLATV